MNVVFVGGPLDGELREVDPRANTYLTCNKEDRLIEPGRWEVTAYYDGGIS